MAASAIGGSNQPPVHSGAAPAAGPAAHASVARKVNGATGAAIEAGGVTVPNPDPERLFVDEKSAFGASPLNMPSQPISADLESRLTRTARGICAFISKYRIFILLALALVGISIWKGPLVGLCLLAGFALGGGRRLAQRMTY